MSSTASAPRPETAAALFSPLETDRAAVLAVVGAGAVAVLEAVDELRAAEAEHGPVRGHDAVAARAQLPLQRGVVELLRVGVLAVEAALLKRVSGPAWTAFM